MRIYGKRREMIMKDKSIPIEVYVVCTEDDGGCWFILSVFSNLNSARNFLRARGFEKTSEGPWIDWIHPDSEYRCWIEPFGLNVVSKANLPFEFPMEVYEDDEY